MSDHENTEAMAVAELSAVGKPLSALGLKQPFMLSTANMKVEDLEKFLPAPHRVRQSMAAQSVSSMVDYLNHRKTDDTVIFADTTGRKVLAVIDYHSKSNDPSWATHKVTYTPELSREFKAWQAQNNKGMTQEVFADWLEERTEDIVEPAGGRILEIANKLQIVKQVVFGQSQKLASGEFQITYNEENQKGTIEIPEKIKVGIPVFHRGLAYTIDARLRYRLNNGAVTFTYKLVEPEHLLETCFDKVVMEIAEKTNLTVYEGLPTP